MGRLKTHKPATAIASATERWLAALCLGLLLAMVMAVPAQAQATFQYVNSTDSATNGLNENTAPCNNPFTRAFSVTDSFIVSDVNIGVLLAHTYRGDLLMWLRAPDGTRIQLTTGFGNGANNYNVLFDDDAGSGISSYTSNAAASPTTTVPPYANSYRPTSSLSGFVGTSSAGTWTLEICDRFNQDSGTFYQTNLFLTSTLTNYADLSLTKTINNSSPVAGATITYSVQVQNSALSPNTAIGVQVTDLLPAGTTYISHSGPGSYNSGTGVWHVGSLAPGASATLTIEASVNATSGASVTNAAEITASSVPDVDSTVSNGANGEDDYDTASFTVSGARTAGIPPVLSCPAGSTLFDWSTRTWAAGTTSNAYTLGAFGNITFNMSNLGAWLSNGAFGGQSPVRQDALHAGTNDWSVVELVDLGSRNDLVTTTINLPTTMVGAQFTIFDVDFGNNQFADRVVVEGRLDGAVVLPTLTNGTVNYVIGNAAYGDGVSNNNSANGNVVVTFDEPIDTIIFYYGNHSLAPTDPGQQGIALHDITFCHPYANLSVTKVSSVASDPVNGSTNPRAIPGALIEYMITISNFGVSPADSGSMVITDDGPANAMMCFDTQGTGQPIVLVDGSTSSGLALGYVAFDDATDSLEFSNDNGSSWTYEPVLDANSCDANITNFRLTPTGEFQAGSSFTLRTSYRIR